MKMLSKYDNLIYVINSTKEIIDGLNDSPFLNNSDFDKMKNELKITLKKLERILKLNKLK